MSQMKAAMESEAAGGPGFSNAQFQTQIGGVAPEAGETQDVDQSLSQLFKSMKN